MLACPHHAFPSVLGPAAPVLRGGPAPAAPGARGAGRLQPGQVRPGEGELSAVAPGPFPTEEVNLKLSWGERGGFSVLGLLKMWTP